LSGKNDKALVLATFLILMLCGAVPWVTTWAAEPSQAPAPGDAQRDKIMTYIRNRFGVPDTVKLSLSELHASTLVPGFTEGTVTVDDGKNKRTQTVLISRDSRFLVVVAASVIDLHQDSSAEMAQRIQEVFKVPATVKISVGAFKPSPSPGFEQGTITFDDGKAPKQDRAVLRTRDGKHLIISELYNLAVDPKQQALHTISLHDEPSEGPASAPVTIVEYADLQCPTCARMHEFLQTKVLPRYGNKVRLVFKEFPLVGIHDWSFTAAIADRCAYEINPSSYVSLRTAIFRDQQLINITNLRDTLLSLGELAGVDRVKLAGCLDAKSSLPFIQRDMAEAKRINVSQTPTVFINGRMMLGLPSEDAYFQAIDQALKGK
jgi:protein-disulfide isomerase